MTNEHVEELYSKFEKGVAKNKRAELETSLKNCDNEKYETLTKLELKSKSPLKETVGLIGWVASLFGCLFLIFNLVIYACVVPMNTDKTKFATKLGNDMSAYAQIAKYELDDAYSSQAVLWLTDKALELNTSEYKYETLSDDLKNFEDGYGDFTKTVNGAYDEYKKAVSEEDATASTDFQAAISNAESAFIEKLQLLTVLDGGVVAAYSSYKTELNKYYSVLSDTSSADEAVSSARKTFEESSAKTDFDNLLITVRDYIVTAKTAVNVNAELTEYKTGLEKYEEDLAKYKKAVAEGKDADKPVKPKLVAGIKEYFGDENGGAIIDLGDVYSSYSAANNAYELNLISEPDDSTLLWWASPILDEVNRNVIKASDLMTYQNGFVEHLNIYKAVINGMPDRLEDILNYYKADGIYRHLNYNEDSGEVLFKYFSCTTKTMRSVLDKTDFEAHKNFFGDMANGFGKFDYSVNLNSEKFLTEDFNNALEDAAAFAVNSISDFESAVVGMENITLQTNTLIKSYQSDTDILSTILTVYNILLAVVLGAYWIALILIYRSKAQAENLKAIHEQIN